MDAWLTSLLAALVGAAAGLVIGINLLNRTLSFFKDGRIKRFLLTGTIVPCILLLGISAGSGIVWPSLAILALAWVGEIALRVHQRRLRQPNHIEPVPSIPQCTSRLPRVLRRYDTTTALHRRQITIPVPGLGAERLRLVFISDWHMTSQMPPGYYEAIIEYANALEPDLALLGGDFIGRRRNMSLLPGALAHLRARLGVYAVLGNHDFWADPQGVAAALDQARIQRLDSKALSLAIAPHTPNSPRLRLQGWEAPWGPGGRPAFAIEAGGAQLVLEIVLCHTPDNIYTIGRAYRAHGSPSAPCCVFAGHVHGGQMRLPGFGPIVVPSRYGRSFDQGHFLVNGIHLLVSSGVGAAEPPLRIDCPPDIIVVDYTQ